MTYLHIYLVKMTPSCRKNNIHELDRNDLRSFDPTVFNITGIPLV